ncbi:hypothetical protein VTO42DRAFT_5039 [Malbranchea cinnamomea]
MNTRSLICVFFQGRFVVAQYTQFDGYPEGQGVDIFKFIRNSENIQRLKDGLQFVYVPDDEELLEIDKKVEKLSLMNREEHPMEYYMFNPLKRHFPSLSCEAGGGILEIIARAAEKAEHLHGEDTDDDEGSEEDGFIEEEEIDETCCCRRRVPIVLALDFANNGSFCEWAYVVDLDKELFEVYGGSQAKGEASNRRWENVGGPDASVPRFQKLFTFEELSKMTHRQFIDNFKEPKEDERDLEEEEDYEESAEEYDDEKNDDDDDEYEEEEITTKSTLSNKAKKAA